MNNSKPLHAAMRDDLPLSITREVRNRCICLHLQRATRAVARRFDQALRPFGLTNGQFSLLMALNRPKAPPMKDIAALLAMDRSTLTATLKPLERRGMVRVLPDEADRRSRLLYITDAGRDALAAALDTWRTTHDEIDRLVTDGSLDEMRSGLEQLAR